MIEIHDYDPNWLNRFEKLETQLWSVVKNHALRIEHVGSTSVAGLAAKPVIDLDIVIQSKEKLIGITKL